MTRNVNRQLKMEWNSPFTDQDLSNDFSTNEVMAIIKTLKVGKAPGPDNFHPEFFLHLDEKCFEWFRILFSLCLKLNTTKTVCSSFHLSNILADFELSITTIGERIPFDKTTKYLGVSLDRTLSYYQHLLNTAANVSKRCNLLKKFASNHCGADFTFLRTSTLALCFSVAEYCCPIWSQSHHFKRSTHL